MKAVIHTTEKVDVYKRQIQCEDLDEDTGEKEYTMLWKRK